MSALAIAETQSAPALAETSPSTRGRVLAALYLFVVAAGITGQMFIADRLVVAHDASATAANITANASLYRLGFTIFMLEMVAQTGVTMLFYDLLKPVHRSVARSAMIVGLTGCGIKAMARLFYYAPLILLGGASYLSAFEPLQREALALAVIRIGDQGAGIALIFFGFQSLLQGWLVIHSGFLPRFLGVLSVAGGLGWLTYLWPPLGAQAFMGVALVALVGTSATIGWLLVRGVDEAKWRARAAQGAASVWR